MYKKKIKTTSDNRCVRSEINIITCFVLIRENMLMQPNFVRQNRRYNTVHTTDELSFFLFYC